MAAPHCVNLLDRLQSVLNAAARFIYGQRKHDHVTPLLRELHWLRVPERITFRLATLAYRCQHNMAPSRRPVKSREQRRLSTAIALAINVRTYRYPHCTLDTRRPCVLCDRSSGVQHLDTVRAVLWVTHSFSTSPEN